MNKRAGNMRIPEEALLAIRALEEAGYEAWCVGGCVRDALLDRPTNDYDIACSAPWQATEHILGDVGFSLRRTGIKHGTLTAVLHQRALEITTFRTEAGYSDGRHPDSVAFARSIEEDLARRDFTINAMAYHPTRGLLDCWKGIEDLDAGIIRTVGNPRRRFKEDGLRILRACRFCSQLGFELDDNTLEAMASCKMMLARVSAERITHELDALLLGEHVHDALMDTIDVLVWVMPEIAACKGFNQHTPYHIYDVWEHTAWVVQHAPQTRLARWTALLHDIGKPAACFFEGDRAHFYGHPHLSAALAEPLMERLLMAPKFIEQVLTLVRIHDDQIVATPKNVRRELAQLNGNVELFRTLIGIKRADALAQSELSASRLELADELERILAELVASDCAVTTKQLAIDGHDLMALGMTSGPEMGAILETLLDNVIDENIPNDHDALVRLASELNAAGTNDQ